MPCLCGAAGELRSSARGHVSRLAVRGPNVPDMPQAEKARNASGGEYRASQQQGKFEASLERGNCRVECVLAHCRRHDMNLTAGNVTAKLGSLLLLARRENCGLPVPVGPDHASSDRSQDSQPHRGADLAARVEQA